MTAILQSCRICQIQPDPEFSDDDNYLKNAIAEAEHVYFRNGLEKQAGSSRQTDETSQRWSRLPSHG